jgi:hypothetical protein
MCRGVHIAVTFLAVLVLLRPLDCFAAGASARKAAECCTKGKCLPTPNSDECCKNAIPSGNQFLTSKATDGALLVLEIVMADVPRTTSQPLVTSLSVEVHPPLGSPPGFCRNLPLLI